MTASRMVPYKKIGLIVEAFNKTPNRRLVVVGTGPQYDEIAAIAGPNVHLVGYQPQEKMVRYLSQAKAFVFAAEEDFGIVAVEAQAAGTPVIGFARGGLGETVIDGRTGILFHEQTPEAIVDACDRFEASEAFDPAAISAHAHGFSTAVFRERFARLISDAWAAFARDKLHRPAPNVHTVVPTLPVDLTTAVVKPAPASLVTQVP